MLNAIIMDFKKRRYVLTFPSYTVEKAYMVKHTAEFFVLTISGTSECFGRIYDV